MSLLPPGGAALTRAKLLYAAKSLTGDHLQPAGSNPHPQAHSAATVSPSSKVAHNRFLDALMHQHNMTMHTPTAVTVAPPNQTESVPVPPRVTDTSAIAMEDITTTTPPIGTASLSATELPTPLPLNLVAQDENMSVEGEHRSPSAGLPSHSHSHSQPNRLHHASSIAVAAPSSARSTPHPVDFISVLSRDVDAEVELTALPVRTRSGSNRDPGCDDTSGHGKATHIRKSVFRHSTMLSAPMNKREDILSVISSQLTNGNVSPKPPKERPAWEQVFYPVESEDLQWEPPSPRLRESAPRCCHSIVAIRLHPEAKFKRIWNFIMILLVLYFTVMIPYRIAFNQTGYGGIDTMENVFAWMFVLDMIFIAITGVRDRLGVMRYSLRYIVGQYMKSLWFFVDLLSIVPVETIQGWSGIVQAEFNSLLRMLRMFKLFRLFRLMRLLNLNTLLGTSAVVASGVSKLLRMTLIIAIILHLEACAWVFVGNAQDGTYNWMSAYRIQNADPFVQYVASIYFTTTFATGTGFGDIVPITPAEQIFVTCLLLVSATGFAFFLGDITALLSGFDGSEAAFTQKIQAINAYARYRKLPVELSQRLISYYEYAYNERKMYPFNEDELLADASEALRAEVAMYLNREIVQSVPYFEGQEPAFVRAVIYSLRSVFVSPGDLIVQEGFMQRELYLLKKGNVQLTTADGFLDIILKDGSYFNEMPLIVRTSCKASIRALTHCDLFVLTKPALKRILVDFPDAARALATFYAERGSVQSRPSESIPCQEGRGYREEDVYDDILDDLEEEKSPFAC